MKSDQSEKRTIPLSDAIVIGGVTLLAYALSHVYELGYAKATGIPNYLVEIGFSKQLFACFAVLVPALTLLSIFYGWYSRVVDPDAPPKRRLLLRFMAPVALVVAACLIYRFKWTEIVIYLILALVFVFSIQVFAVIGAVKRSSKKNKVMHSKSDIEDSPTTIFDPVVQKYGVGAFWGIIAIIILFLVAFMSGRAESLFQEDYLVLYDKKPYVVLRFYGDKAILRGVDKGKHLFTNEIQIRRMGEQNGVILKSETIGPFLLKKQNTNN